MEGWMQRDECIFHQASDYGSTLALRSFHLTGSDVGFLDAQDRTFCISYFSFPSFFLGSLSLFPVRGHGCISGGHMGIDEMSRVCQNQAPTS